MHQSYVQLRPQLVGDTGYDRFFNGPLNNASLLIISTYTCWVPAFRTLLAQNSNDLRAFYPAVKRLAQLLLDRRQTALEKLMLKSTAAK